MLAGPSGARNSWSIETKKSTARLVGNDLYKEFLNHVLTEEQLFNNGYPRKHPSGERGIIINHSRVSGNSRSKSKLKVKIIFETCL